MRYDWRKQEKEELYGHRGGSGCGGSKQKFIMISGKESRSGRFLSGLARFMLLPIV